MGITWEGCSRLDLCSPYLVRLIPKQAGLEPVQKAQPVLLLRGEALHLNPRRGSCYLSQGGDFSPQNADAEKAFDL